MPNQKIELGKFGEEIAAKHLLNKGYKILAKNYYTRQGELDLVCKKSEVIHFVEVKTRISNAFGWPEEAVTEEKIEKISCCAQKYLEQINSKAEWQIDIIGIIIERNKAVKIELFENVN